ncbi:MAG TPA: AccI family restriction endonuclease [Pyrinomonadaceae bacterium]|nr:AccI family restriction endonuclease [Pyrinomonadaceae bacterium]
MTYRQKIEVLAKAVQATLAKPKSKRSEPIAVDFAAPHKPGRAPGDANSEFLINRAMGDWAETSLQKTLAANLKGFRVVKYGNSDQMVAGEEGFGDFYREYQQELATIGKRPDLLVFSDDHYDECWDEDISTLPLEQLRRIVPQASHGIEVRSSKVLGDKYTKVRQEQLKAGIKVSQEEHSFTVKVEDLTLVKRWIDTYGVKHLYAQVLLDSAYMIQTEKILSLVASRAKGVAVRINRRNQNKPTIHVPLSYGARIADIKRPKFDRVKEKESKLGRIDPYVEPTGGKLLLKKDVFMEALNSEEQQGAAVVASPDTLF